MEDFTYHRPAKIADAVKLIKSKKDGQLLSGGQTLIPTMKQNLAEPTDIIDLSGLGNNTIKVLKTKVTIGAGATHAEVAGNKDLKKAVPALAGLAGEIGDPHVRHKGTIGGSLANNDPAADYPAAVLALGATIVTNKRKIEAGKFFKGLFETALGRDEIITQVDFPIPEKAGYAKFANPASRYALVGVFAAKLSKETRVGVTGAGPGVFRSKAIEKALSENFTAKALSGVTVEADDLNEDIHASPAYRAHLIVVMAKRAITSAK